MKKILGILLIAFLFTGCGDLEDFFDARHDDAVDLNDNSGSDTGDGDKDMTLDFATIKRVVLQDNCINCHTPEGYHSAYENYNIVKASTSVILERMTTANASRVMPKGRARLDQATIELFEKWVDAGAPEFAKSGDDDKQPPPKAPEAQISFAQIRLEVLEPNNCTGCHSQYNDYATVRRAIGGIVSAISPENQWMPFPQKQGGDVTPVPQEHLDLLDKWISQGLPEFAFKEAQEPPAPVLEPNWISLRDQVIGPKCILCHNSYGPRAPGAMDTYTALQAWYRKKPALFDTDPDSEEHGTFMVTINQDPDNPFAFPSPMPFNNDFDDILNPVPRVTEDEKTVLMEWIKAGLPHGN